MSQYGGLHSLPPELLINILLDVVQSHDASLDDESESRGTYSGSSVTTWHYAKVHELASICKSWTALISAAPQFWTRVSSSLPPRVSEQFLRKSGSTPLEALYEFNGQEAIWFRNQFTPHFERIRKFVLEVDQQGRLPPVLLPDLTGTNLDTLQIICRKSRSGEDAHPIPTLFRPTVFATVLPGLRRLLHHGAPITLNWSAMSTLTHLDIRNCDPQILNHGDWALFILRNNPGLVSVAFTNLQHTGPMPTQPPSPLHLDHLESLSLIRNTTSFTRRILAAIVAPACVRADIEFRGMPNLSDGGPEFGVEASLLNWSADLERLAHSVILRSYNAPSHHVGGLFILWEGHEDLVWRLASSSRLRFSLTPGCTLDMETYTLRRWELAFQIQSIYNDPSTAALYWLTRICNALSGHNIEVDVSFVENPRQLWANMPLFWDELANVPYVTTLNLDLWSDEEVVAFFLREPPVLPSLSFLSLRLIYCTSDFMIPVIRYRNSNANVTRLKELRITSRTIDPEPPEELKELLGVGNLVWHKDEELDIFED